jgi:hypothetical protein
MFVKMLRIPYVKTVASLLGVLITDTVAENISRLHSLLGALLMLKSIVSFTVEIGKEQSAAIHPRLQAQTPVV